MATGLGNSAVRRAQLVEAIRFTPAESACRACLDHLDGYIAAQLAGQDYIALLPAVAAHLDACPECATAYARLYELEVAAWVDCQSPAGAFPSTCSHTCLGP